MTLTLDNVCRGESFEFQVPSHARSGDAKRVLVALEDSTVRERLSCSLRRMGYRVVSVDSGSEAWEWFSCTGFDLVLLGSDLSGLDSWRLAVRIKEKAFDTPIVLLQNQVPDPMSKDSGEGWIDFIIDGPDSEERVLHTVEFSLYTSSPFPSRNLRLVSL